MNQNKKLTNAPTIAKYLAAENNVVKAAIGQITSSVQAAANQSVQTLRHNRERISDATDHLDGILTAELQMSQADELKEIMAIAQELNVYYDQSVYEQAFSHMDKELQPRLDELAQREAAVKKKEEEIEKIIHARVADAEAKARRESTTSKGLFESALVKAEKVFDQNKITRFACSTISMFQEEFKNIHTTRDVEFVTKLFQETIEPFQTVKMIANKDGKLTKVITNSFSEDCYQDLFFFFYKYYNELLDIYEREEKLPSTAEELARIFRKEKRGAEQIIARLHQSTRK